MHSFCGVKRNGISENFDDDGTNSTAKEGLVGEHYVIFLSVSSSPGTVSIVVQIREELHQAVKGAEESLLHLKRARLFREVDAMAQPQEPPSEAVSGSDLVDAVSPQPFSMSSKCRFRHSDGRWYNGCVLGVENDSVARVAFLHPTSDKMQVWLFGSKMQSHLFFHPR